MKKIILFFFSFCLLRSLFSNETIVLYSFEDYINKHESKTEQLLATLNSEGRIISYRYTNGNYTCMYSYKNGKVIVNVIYDELDKNPLVYEEIVDIQIDEQKQTYSILSGEMKWFFENGCLSWKNIKTDSILQVILYIKKNNNNEQIVSNIDDNYYSAMYTKPSMEIINKIKSKDKNINLYNAKILTLIGPQDLIPYLLFDDDFNPTANSYTATSELKEKDTIYKAENLRNVEGLPWASANGKGINDKIRLEFFDIGGVKINLYNGFQDPQRQYLYKANSRVKKIRITNLDNKKSAVVELEDTPEKQTFKLGKLYFQRGKSANLEIEILEVYPGEKYDDLCIQAIIPEY